MPRAAFIVQHTVETPFAVERGIAHVEPDSDGIGYTIVASAAVGRDPQRQGLAHVTVVTFKDEAGFRGRQWQTTERETGRAIGEGQHRTLREAAQETIMLAVQRAEVNRLMRGAIEKEENDVPETVDMTPTWSALVSVLVDVAANEGAPTGSRIDARKELARMARLADAYVEAANRAGGVLALDALLPRKED